MNWVINNVKDLISLIFPSLCITCGHVLLKEEKHVCNSCYLEISSYEMKSHHTSELEKVFYGRISFGTAGAFLRLDKSSKPRKLLHSIKYKGNKELALDMGYQFGIKLRAQKNIMDIHCVIPVPLHPKKKRIRGYNQSEEFAKGISKALNIPLVGDALIRKDFTSTQTKKNRLDRWENVMNAFELINPDSFKNKTVLLIDDVITTGATMEACALHLNEIEGVQIHLAALAYAQRN